MSRRTIQLGLAWIALVAAGLGVGIWPAWRNFIGAGQSIRQARSALAAASDGPSLLQRRTESVKHIRAFADEHTKPIPVDGDIAGFVRGLVNYLDGLGVSEREIATGAAARENDVWAAPMTISMNAEFQHVYATLEYIETLPRLVRISRFRATRVPDGRLHAELSLDVVFTGRDATVAAPEEAKP